MAEARIAKLKDAEKIRDLLFDLMVRFEKMDSFDRQDRRHWKESAPAEIRKLIRKRSSDFIILEENGKIMGVIEVIISKREGVFSIKKNGHIETTYLDPRYRKKGYGRILHDKAMEWFKKKKVSHVTVGTHAKDKKANSFWKKMGFREYNLKYRKSIQ